LAGVTIQRNPHENLFQDPDCRRGVCGHCYHGLLASSLGIQSGHGLHVCWPRQNVGDGHGGDAQEPRRDDEERKKVPANTVFFMEKGQLYSTSGMLDPTGNFYLP
jgi:hypothetical protein